MTDPRRLAAHPAPHTMLTELGRCPIRRLDDGWYVASRPDDVETLLTHPDASIGFVPAPGDRTSALQASLARFSDGESHRRRRAAIEQVLAPLGAHALRTATSRAVRAGLPAGTTVDLMVLARRIPVLVLADALAVADPESAVGAVDLLCRRLAPMTGTAARPPDTAVMDAVERAFGTVDELDELAMARLALLFQAMDATAALIAAAFGDLGGDRPAAATPPPIMLTTRTLTASCRVGNATLPVGAAVVVHVGAATVTATASFIFGRGPHRCPGADLATAIAAGFRDGLASRSIVAVDDPGTVTYEPRPNLRLPGSVMVRVARRPGGSRAGESRTDS
jgi:cytochrome P450